MTADGESERLVERRLRQALEARAESVTLHDLRPAAPPRRPARRPSWRERRPAYRLRLAGLTGLAAAAAVGVAYLTAQEPAAPRPVPPANPPAITSPTPTPTPTPAPNTDTDRSVTPNPAPSPSAVPTAQPSVSVPANGPAPPPTALTPAAPAPGAT